MTALLLRACGVIVLLLVGVPAEPSVFVQPSLHAQAATQAPPGFDEALTQANDLLRQRKYEEALKLFKRANEMKNNSSLDCLWGMAQAYHQLGATKNVIEATDRVVQLAGEDRKMIAVACNLKGQAIYAQAREKRDRKKYAEAEAAFRSALEANPDLHVAHFNLGSALMGREQDAAGVEEMKIYVERDPRGGYTNQARRLIENPRRARENFAPDFSFVTLDGAYLNSDELRGKVVVLDFWATWCQPCVATLDDVVRLAKKYADREVVVISVSGDTDTSKWRGFVAEHKMSWPQVLDNRRAMQNAFAVRAIPTYFVIDQEGIVREQVIGTGQFGRITSTVNDCLKKQKQGSTAGRGATPGPAANYNYLIRSWRFLLLVPITTRVA